MSVRTGLLLSIVLGLCSITPSDSAMCGEKVDEQTDRILWVQSSLKRMETITVGMTRRELLQVFKTEGGLSNRTHRTYVYQECQHFKVDVVFEPVGMTENRLSERGEDRIVKISRPYVGWSYND
jgi:hypothetical protein